jgi:L-ascorbate metabolism protein UlaG (beta-lactamase superfamily)
MGITDMNYRRMLALLGLVAGLCWSILLSAEPKMATAGTGGNVTIEYVAHACFRITSPSGDRLVIDPYGSRIWIGYDYPAGIDADTFLISHPHYDHDGGVSRGRDAPWPDKSVVLRQPGAYNIGEIQITGVMGKHADPYGKEFGQTNTIWLLETAGIRIVHLGDNGPLSADAVKQLGQVDILMLPADADYHILKEQETIVILQQLSPSVVIPMHYRLPDLEQGDGDPEGLGNIGGWLESRQGVRHLSTHQKVISHDTLPVNREILVFEHWPELQRPAGQF